MLDTNRDEGSRPRWLDGLKVWAWLEFYIRYFFRGLRWMCRCFWRYTLGWGLKFKEIKPQMPKCWVLGGRTSLPSSLVRNLLSQVVLDSKNLSSRWQVVSFFFFQTFSEFHFLIMEKHLETQKSGPTSRCFRNAILSQSTLQISRQELVGLNYCLLWPRWLGRFSWEGTPSFFPRELWAIIIGINAQLLLEVSSWWQIFVIHITVLGNVH